MSGLDDRQRKALSRLVVSARTTLFDDAEKTLRGTYGILPGGIIQSEAGLAPDPSLRARRRTLEAVVDHLRADGTSAKGAVERLMREVAFTHLNRLLAIRVADALGVLAPSLRDGTQSSGFRQWIGDLAPLLATADDTGGYWTYLSQCADELAVDAPALFDPRNPLLALRPSKSAFDGVVELLADPENADLWDADDTFGWAYQFFNTRDERQEMRKSSAPRDSRELAVRNQFFTPDYVVRFLVQNTLGRRLVDADPSTPLLDQLPLLLDPPTTRGTPVDLVQIKVLDPACGSGHFLLGCYDVLEAAWGLAGVLPAEAAARIVPCLWGVDIDPRAVQVAQAAVVFRARRSCGRSPLPPPNIVCARSLPEDPAAWDNAEEGLSEDLRRLVKAMRVALRDAPLLGPLLKAEQRLASEIRTTVVGANDAGDDLFSTAGIAHDAFGSAERAVIAALQRAADATSATPVEQLLAAGASDAVRLVEAVRNRYDAVLMNPPFGLAVPETEQYLKSAYRLGWTDLYACFVLRALELLAPSGYSGSITSNQYFTSRKMLGLRKLLLGSHRPITVVDLGAGVLYDAAVQTSCQVIPHSRSTGSTLYLDIAELTPEDQAWALDPLKSEFQQIDLAKFRHIDGLPFAFHVADENLSSWNTSEARFEPDVGIVRSGGKPFDNFRFIRCRWEVDPSTIGTDWVSYHKGGEFRPYWASSHLVLNWRRDGAEVKAFGAERGVLPQVLQGSTFWRRPGLCYPRANKMLGVRVLPCEEIFAEKSIAIFPSSADSLLAVLLFLNSAPVAELLSTFGRSRFIENGSIKRLPVGIDQVNELRVLESRAVELLNIGRADESLDETTSLFCGFSLSSDDWAERADLAHCRVLNVQREVDTLVESVVETGTDALRSNSSDYAERIEVIAGSLVAKPRPDEWARRLVSYLVGVAFGRWRPEPVSREDFVDRDEFFRSLPAYAPAAGPALVDRGAGVADGVLVEEVGQGLDLVARVEHAATALEGSAYALDEALLTLGEKSVRDYVRRNLFRDHLARYSKSRRQAPVYWQLTIPSGSWSAWLYAPRFSREMLYAVVALADHRLAGVAERIRSLQEDTSRSDRQRAKAVDEERTLAGELQELRDDVARLAGLGWQPDLDDGFVLCAAPLAKWFPRNTWRQLGEKLASIKRGDYPWATLHKFRDAL